MVGSRIAAFATVSALSGVALAQSNPGFESGIGGNANDWTEIAFGGPGAFAARSNVAHSGTWGMQLAADGADGIGTRAFCEQGGIGIAENQDITFSIFARVNNPLGPGVVASVYVFFFDAGNGVVGVASTGIGGLLTSDWSPFAVSATAPANAVSALVGFDLSGGAFDASDGTAFFDDAEVRIVPAPATLGVLGLLVGRRRRR
ncbi:MAG: hypothetical protein RBS39_01820 [Phycisphaerales bacterium]|jgi:MYXO-CTERM domain-containing protein|nr:hypothetical protein [Phycisphaerales bacterium]